MKRKPYNLLLLTGLVLVLTSFFVSKQDDSVDIHIHDTIFVIAHTHIFWLLAILSFFVWVLYILTNGILYSKALVWAHVIITNLTLLLLGLILFFGSSFGNPTPGRYLNSSDWNFFENYIAFTKAIGITMFVLMIGQMIFVINFILGLLTRLTNRRR